MNLIEFASDAARSDKFTGRGVEEHKEIIAIGLLGEIGSVLAEVKKMLREATAYPAYESRLVEEVGDALWYFVRLCDLCGVALTELGEESEVAAPAPYAVALDLGTAAGRFAEAARASDPNLRPYAHNVLSALRIVAACGDLDLSIAMAQNARKRASRWPTTYDYCPLFDDDMNPEDQIPREFEVLFIERSRNRKTQVLLRYHGINIGARLTDNIMDADGYRYHDIFHMAHAVYLGWSPVVRSLLKCKRKSKPEIDENQDGARAIIIEEGVAAMTFSRAKHMRFFEGAAQIDYDLLKAIADFVRGYEVEHVDLWQWERAILEGYRVFRQLKAHQGGYVSWDLKDRTLRFRPAGPPPYIEQ